MTAVANPPSFANIIRPAWGSGNQALNGSNNHHDDVRGMFAPRKSMQRTNSSSSIASNTSNGSSSSTVTVIAANGNGSTPSSSFPSSSSSSTDSNGLPITTLRKRPPNGNTQWASNRQNNEKQQADFSRNNSSAGGTNGVAGRQQQQLGTGPNGVSPLHQLPLFQASSGSNGTNGTNGIMARQQAAEGGAPTQAQPVLYLVSLNGTFDRKTISVPFQPDTLRIGRQTNKNTIPDTVNGFFDSKVLSRQHAEIYADRQGTIWIRDIKSSNGTFVNGTRLSAENRESEPHELQTNDHLELGIDIVSEDQKSVVHHKVAAKVEHAGFIKSSNNLLEMNFGDLDPGNSGMMAGSQLNGLPFRGRTGSQASLGVAGRMTSASNLATAQNNGLAMQRGLWLTGPSTEAIVKKIHQEMRNAKQQSQDLQRTQDFIQALLSKDDIRNDTSMSETTGVAASQSLPLRPLQKQLHQPQAQPLQTSSGSSNISFRTDPKARFSDPPAPPPQQPLPEKPAVPSLKRGSTERPKSGNIGSVGGPAVSAANKGNNTSPIRPDIMSQVFQLNDALNVAKREIATHVSRVRELEEKLHKEQEARRFAEELTQHLEGRPSMSTPADKVDTAALASTAPPLINGASKKPHYDSSAVLGEGTDNVAIDYSVTSNFKENIDFNAARSIANEKSEKSYENFADAALRSRIDSMMTEMEGMKRQLKAFQERAEKAEAERDADRETLAKMVQRIRQRDEDEANKAAAAAALRTAATNTALTGKKSAPALCASSEEKASMRSPSRGRSVNGYIGTAATSTDRFPTNGHTSSNGSAGHGRTTASAQNDKVVAILDDDVQLGGAPLCRSDTITPASLAHKVAGGFGGSVASKVAHDPAVLHGIPYASMVGVVLLGMGLMAYINGWQPAPRLER